MFRYIGFLVFYSLFCLPGIAQILADEPTGLARTNGNQREIGTRGESRVSLRRLKVPRKARRLYEKALQAWKKDSPAEAQRRLDQALKLDPTFPEALTFSGGVHASRQEWESAEQSLQAAIESDPTYAPAYTILAGVYNAEKHFDEAQRATQQALRAGANTWCVQYEIARSLIGKGQYENALVITEAALRPKDHGSLLHLAKAHALLGLRRYPEASTELRTFLADDPAGDGSQNARELLERVQRMISKDERIPPAR